MPNVIPTSHSAPITVTANDIISFWFSTEAQALWFNSTPEFDHDIKNRFESLWQQVQQDNQLEMLTEWSQSPEGVLALCILLDQFPLNMFRGEARSFQTESLAITLAKQGITNGFDLQIPHDELMFFYMPLMHSETLEDQNQSVELFSKAGLTHNMRFAQHHQSLIKRFGRFPHRNRILGRTNTPEEVTYLNSKEAFTG
jgi:uncharacterized protein (DUF924 family)